MRWSAVDCTREDAGKYRSRLAAPKTKARKKISERLDRASVREAHHAVEVLLTLSSWRLTNVNSLEL